MSEKTNPSVVIEKLIKEYYLKAGNYKELVEWIYNCLTESLIESYPANAKETYLYQDCIIEYLTNPMVFSLLKPKEKVTQTQVGKGFYEVSIWLASYLKAYYGQTTLEILRKVLFFSDIDLRELSLEIADDISSWHANISKLEGVFSQP
jgi:hypothetical protein